MKKKLLVATNNKGKIAELNEVLKDLDFEVLSLREIDSIPKGFDVEEPAMTMEGNAIIKAITYGKKSGILTLADDSGLEVEALNGRPGVLSARYVPGTDEDRYLKILEELKGLPPLKRNAQFRCVICIYDPETEKIRTCDGVYKGTITEEVIGENGFGYDPIFWNEELNKTNAEMTMEEKNKVSHRGKAIEKAKDILKKEF